MRRVNLSFVIVVVLSLTAGLARCEPYGGGSGTVEEPYLIYTPEQMNAVGANPGHWDRYFKLMADIDLSDYTGTQFNIIRTHGTGFSGVFDGNDHEVSNFTYISSQISTIGFFRLVSGPNAVVKDLRLMNPNMDCGPRGVAGSLVGNLTDGATLSGCTSEGGGVYGHHTRATIRKCIIRNNHAGH